MEESNNSTEPTQGTPSAEAPIFLQAEDYSEFYFNHVQAGYTGFDIYAFVSEVAKGHDGRLIVRQKARMTMSPMQALLLSNFLRNAVTQYEAYYGIKVEVPESVHRDNES